MILMKIMYCHITKIQVIERNCSTTTFFKIHSMIAYFSNFNREIRCAFYIIIYSFVGYFATIDALKQSMKFYVLNMASMSSVVDMEEIKQNFKNGLDLLEIFNKK